MPKWDFTGWSLLSLIQLQASWGEIFVSTPDERTRLDIIMEELRQALAVLDPGGCAKNAQAAPLLAAGGNEGLSELDRVEGYDRADYVEATDQELCRGVLQSWMDFCRDKGLL